MMIKHSNLENLQILLHVPANAHYNTALHFCANRNSLGCVRFTLCESLIYVALE